MIERETERERGRERERERVRERERERERKKRQRERKSEGGREGDSAAQVSQAQHKLLLDNSLGTSCCKFRNAVTIVPLLFTVTFLTSPTPHRILTGFVYQVDQYSALSYL